MVEPLQKIVEEEGTCKHDKIVITGEFSIGDNPDGERRQLYFANCLNEDCLTSLLRDLREWEQTDKTDNTSVIYKRTYP